MAIAELGLAISMWLASLIIVIITIVIVIAIVIVIIVVYRLAL